MYKNYERELFILRKKRAIALTLDVNCKPLLINYIAKSTR